MKSDLVLPTPLFTEKNGIFVNIEGRPQEARKCHNPIGSGKEEWAILKKLSQNLSFDFEPNTFDELREELFQKHSKLFEFQEIIHEDSTEPLVDDISFEDCKPLRAIENFYMSDIISKNSVTMAKCVEEILDKPLMEKSA